MPPASEAEKQGYMDYLEQEAADQRLLLEECWDWLEAGLSLSRCRKLGWIDFRRRLAAHLGKDPAPW